MRKQRRKNPKLPFLICMIVVGMNPPAMIFAAVGFAVAHRYWKKNVFRRVKRRFRSSISLTCRDQMCYVLSFTLPKVSFDRAYGCYRLQFFHFKTILRWYSKIQTKGTRRKIPPIKAGAEAFLVWCSHWSLCNLPFLASPFSLSRRLLYLYRNEVFFPGPVRPLVTWRQADWILLGSCLHTQRRTRKPWFMQVVFS